MLVAELSTLKLEPGSPMAQLDWGPLVTGDRCTVHHVVHWADGGSDELSNLRLLCGRHHGLLHPENARFRQGAGLQRSAR